LNQKGFFQIAESFFGVMQGHRCYIELACSWSVRVITMA